MTTRRSFLTGLGSLLAAPAVITTPGLLMPVKALPKRWVPCVAEVTVPLGFDHGWLMHFQAEVLAAYNEVVPALVQLHAVHEVHDSFAVSCPETVRLVGPGVLDIETHPRDFRGRVYPRRRAQA